MKTPESAKTETFTSRQWAVLRALTEPITQAEAARRAKCSDSAISKWMKDPAFVAKLEEMRGERHQIALDVLRAAVTDAVALLTTTTRAVRASFKFEEDEDGNEVLKSGPDSATLNAGLRAAGEILDRTGVLKGQTVTMQDGAPADPPPQRTPEEVANALQDELSSLPVEMLAQALAEAQQLQGGPVGEAK